MVGDSLTIAIFFVLVSKSLLLKCFAVLQLEFFSLAKNRLAEILCVFQENILQLKGKRLGQNRIMSYETPPNHRGDLLFIINDEYSTFLFDLSVVL